MTVMMTTLKRFLRKKSAKGSYCCPMARATSTRTWHTCAAAAGARGTVRPSAEPEEFLRQRE